MTIAPANAENIARAAAALRRGEIVAFPTETLYGLGANALDASAVEKVFAAKGRASGKPLIVLVSALAEAEAFAKMSASARELAEAFWPGPLTLVLPRRADCPLPDAVSAGLDTIAVRVPSHPVALALLAEAKLPITAPSANRSGRRSPKTAADVEAELGDRPAMILDGGSTPLGVESTIVGLAGPAPTLLRSGALPREAIEKVLGQGLLEAAQTRAVGGRP
jgi:L-threonylcarbamoyladenylate synthase